MRTVCCAPDLKPTGLLAVLLLLPLPSISARSRAPRARPQAGAVIVVTTTNDSGEGSLRDAIDTANSTPEHDIVTFAIPGGGVHTIRPTSSLPVIEAPATIDGTTQPGFAGTPSIELAGDDAGPGVGLCLDGGGCTVRGLAINGFESHGIEMIGGGGNHIEGNFVGTDPTGTLARPNGQAGVFVNDSTGNVIGGDLPGTRNVISGNSGEGVFVEGPLSADNLVTGNYVGTTASGTGRLGNGLVGVFVTESAGNVVSGNVVSGNGYEGVSIEGAGATGNVVTGNLVGTGANGSGEIGNTFAGIALAQTSSGNVIGGTGPGEGNRVAYNRADGVHVTAGRANRILGNAIFSNRGVGITLGGRDTTSNDDGDVDTGPNDLQNYPVLRTATSAGETTTVTGTLGSHPATAFRLEFFANAQCDTYGFGEGEMLLGGMDVVTDQTGSVSFTAVLPATAGAFVSATATDPEGNTSEFSSCVRVDLSWEPPDFTSGETKPPPRNLSAAAVAGARVPSSPASGAARGPALLGYKVYGSNRPGMQPSTSTLLTSVPPSRTSATIPTDPAGSFFVVTAVYDTGESDPSNEAEGGQPPQVAAFRVKAKKIVADGALFTDSVLVIVDGLPFLSPAKVKKRNSRVVQSGTLVTGQTIAEYLASLRPRPDGTVSVLIGFRNSTGGVTTVEHQFRQ